jgi:hypothetical protein
MSTVTRRIELAHRTNGGISLYDRSNPRRCARIPDGDGDPPLTLGQDGPYRFCAVARFSAPG